jgi:hypothetical protein
MRFGVVVREDESFVEVEGPRREPDERGEHSENSLRVSGYNHGLRFVLRFN